MALKFVSWLSENKLKIMFAGSGYILAWGYTFYTKNTEMAKMLMFATIGFLFGVGATK